VAHFGRDTFADDLGEPDLVRLAGLDLNGREIKNLIKSAQLLSARLPGGKVTAEKLHMLAQKRVEALRMFGVMGDKGGY